MRTPQTMVLAILVSASACRVIRPEERAVPPPPSTATLAAPTEYVEFEHTRVPVSSDTVVRLERSSCYGTCPHYSLELLADGRVTFVGEDHVAEVGERTRTIPPECVAFVLRVAQYEGFDEIDPNCADNVSDVPSTTISIRENGRTRTVVNRWSLGLSIYEDLGQ